MGSKRRWAAGREGLRACSCPWGQNIQYLETQGQDKDALLVTLKPSNKKQNSWDQTVWDSENHISLDFLSPEPQGRGCSGACLRKSEADTKPYLRAEQMQIFSLLIRLNFVITILKINWEKMAKHEKEKKWNLTASVLWSEQPSSSKRQMFPAHLWQSGIPECSQLAPHWPGARGPTGQDMKKSEVFNPWLYFGYPTAPSICVSRHYSLLYLLILK